MNKTLTTTIGALIAIAGYSAPALATADVSISVGQPGFYGRIDLGDAPRPRVLYSQPRYVQRDARNQEPVYLHVRPGESRNWKRHCRTYDACGQRVYFVQDNWYNNVYVPHYRGRGNRDNNGRDDGNHGQHHRRDNRDDNRGDNHRNDDRRDDRDHN